MDAIPDLIQAVPRLISAIVETLMSINWLEVGLDIVKESERASGMEFRESSAKQGERQGTY